MTAKNMIVKLPTDARGNYRTDKGFKIDQDGKRKQHRFYLGRDRLQAQLRALNIEGIWTAIEKRSKGPATWDRLRLAVAMAISRGDETFQVDPAEYGLEFGDWMGDGIGDKAPVFFPNEEAKLAWFRELQEECKGIRLVLAGEAESVKTVEDQAQGYKRVADRLKATARPSSEQTLHQALDAFGQWLGRHYLDASGRTSTFGTACQRQAGNIKEHSADVKLSAFGCSAIEDLIAYWKNRPQTKRGKACSPDHARNCIKRIRHFVKWLHRSDAWDWKKPFDLELDPVRISLTPAERAAKLSTTQVESYSPEELAVLWKYASPKERLPMLLALNCGFGQAEIGTLQLAEVHLREAHGHYPLVGSFIKRLRGKTGIYGEWKLWPETEAALDWYLARRPETTETALLVTKDGRSLAESTPGGNRNGRLANAWNGLTARVRKDRPDFRGLSFNKLRKTAGNLVKKESDGEIAGCFHSRSQTVKTDDLADVYTDRPFDRVFAALDAVRSKLAPVFAAAQDPFPQDGKKSNPSISLGIREKIVAMRQEGKSYAEIHEATGVSIPTILVYLKRAGLVKEKRRPKG